MMDYTDRYFRMLMRMITKQTLLYSEMISTGAILYGDRQRQLDFDIIEKPVVLQLGGNKSSDMVSAAKIAEDYGFDEININAGCPSERVKMGMFGVCLMADTEETARMIENMVKAVSIPVSIKCRIGLDGTAFGMPVYDSYEHLENFARAAVNAGAARITVHARIAVLGRLDPQKNREIPPLRYKDVYRLAAEISEVPIEINGGIRSLAEASRHLRQADAAMIGRAAIEDPFLFSQADSLPHTETVEEDLAYPNHEQKYSIAHCYADYLAQQLSLAKSEKKQRYIARALRHLFSFFRGEPGARSWRKSLSLAIAQRIDPAKAVEKAVAAMKQRY